MKYRSFRKLVIIGVLVVGGGLMVLGSRSCSEQPGEQPLAAVAEPREPLAQQADEIPTPATNHTPGGLREMDLEIMVRVAQGMTQEKIKDLFEGAAYKVNLYQEPGSTRVARLKVDLDRDGKWDEKWTLTPEVRRAVSPGDDGAAYTAEYELQGERWIRAGGSAVEETAPGAGTRPKAAAVDTAPAPGPAAVGPEGRQPLRELDTLILQRVAQGIGGKKEKDAFRDSSAKVNLYQDQGQASVNRAKVDLDRDDKWDEKWTLSGDKVKRQVAPGDDGDFAVEYRLRAGAWVLKK